MFEKSSTWQRFKQDRPQALRVHLGYVPALETDDREAKIRWRIAIAVALLFHLGVALVQLPELIGAPSYVGADREVYVVQPIRFKPPPPQTAQPRPRQVVRKRKIPIPDPTPDEPEPIVEEQIEIPDTDLSDLDDAIFGASSVPAIPGGMGRWPMKVGRGVLPPKKIYTPAPPYTEEARQGRIQGVVILEAIIDEQGNVRDVKILKGLALGLSEAAAETARAWRFEPATLNGEPVPVYFNLTVRFSLQ